MTAISAQSTSDAKKGLFDWSSWRTRLPKLEPHSQAKLDVLRQYIEDYIRILCTGNPGQDRFRLTLVDGFAGGGIYRDQKPGSPFVLLEAVEVAEALLNQTRTKRLSVDCHFYFVEDDNDAADCLEHQLRQRGFEHRLNRDVHLIRGDFKLVQNRIVAESSQRFSRGGSRVLFFLDQCGYTDAPPSLLRSISERLNLKAEFIVNFAIDWLTAYVADEKTFRKIYPGLGLDQHLPIDDVLKAIADQRLNPQYIVESMIGPAYQNVSQSPFFSPFYIQAPRSNRGYWLVHLAPQRRARTAMLDVYWRVANGCRHFGHTGLDMLSFRPDADPTGYLQGLEFGDSTRTDVQKKLQEELPKEIRAHHAGGVIYREFLDLYCNRTMANEEIIKNSLLELKCSGEIDVTGQRGGTKRVDSINADDIISPGKSPVLFSLPLCSKAVAKQCR